MSAFKLISDVFASLIICILASIILVFKSNAVWSVFGFGGLWAAKKLYESATNKKVDKSATVKWESDFTDWFIVIKSITSAVGVILINIFRQQGWYTLNTHYITLFFLDLNIFEAVFREYELGYYSNAIVGIGLMSSIPYSLSIGTIQALHEETLHNHCFLFPLSLQWIIIYTSWNACFSYGDNMSWQNRLILIPPILIAMSYDVKLWLGARVLLLLLHLLLRAIQIMWIYQPGASALTPIAGSIKNSKEICRKWGQVNMVMFFIFGFSYITYQYITYFSVY